MKRIGLLSDTHGFLDPKIKSYFEEVDEIWHAGDIGTLEILDELKAFKPTRAVWGNIDGHQIRQETKEFLTFSIEDTNVLITHIGGKPGKYSKPVLQYFQMHNTPKRFICGNSHIALVKMDTTKNMLYINPGACGYKGFHAIKTIVRFSITKDRIHDFELIELGKRTNSL